MNIHAYTLDSLRRLVRALLKENRELKQQLKINPDIEEKLFTEDVSLSEYDEDQGSRIESKFITEQMAREFFALFHGRHDVFAVRGKNGGYYPKCKNFWKDNCPKRSYEKQNCSSCPNKQLEPLSLNVILKHLIGYKEDGTDVIGIYPLFSDGTCRFIVFDFDDHINGSGANDYSNINGDWKDEVSALREICKEEGISALVERSRSGNGAHVWILFSKPIRADVARNFGSLLLEKGRTLINLRSFNYFDRMFPTQDFSNGLGNLIALPLQGMALQKGNSAFVDEQWNAYPDQWEYLYNHVHRLSPDEIEQYIEKWQAQIYPNALVPPKFRPKPWERNEKFNSNDVDGIIHIVLSDGVYVDTLNLKPRIQNQIRALAAFNNPIYYKNKGLGYSNYNQFSSIYLGCDINGYIKLPRGLREKLLNKCNDSGIKYEIEDLREKGRPIRVSFKGELKTPQKIASQILLSYEDGILSAATAFGKTVVCSYLISKRKVNTLILVEKKELLNQWVEELNTFLDIDELPPSYLTKTGREKVRKSVIGTLSSGKNDLTGIIDVAMVGSVYGNSSDCKLTKKYGMVIFDECHHAASATSQEVLNSTNSKFVYGVSATPTRSDKLEKIIFMMIGPIRHSYSAKERAAEQGIGHFVFPRYTHVVQPLLDDSFYKAYKAISTDQLRNEMIISDIKRCISQKRSVLVLTRLKDHAKLLYDKLDGVADNVFILYGDNSDKENKQIVSTIKSVPDSQSMIIVATGQKAGEGSNFPRLDTLMMVMPISDGGLLEQYVGRLNRDYPGKQNVVVYDYIDSHLRVFDNMYNKRLKTYKKIGFDIITNATIEKQNANSIYNSSNYIDTFEKDIIEANKSVIVSSEEILHYKIERFISLVSSRIENGVDITVVLAPAEISCDGDDLFFNEITDKLKTAGINVSVSNSSVERFAIMDDEIVWHGSVNFFGKEDYRDNLLRVISPSTASELKEISFG